MSRRRPSERDRVERDYLALAKERAESNREYDLRLAAMQRELDRLEGGRLPDGQGEAGPRTDALDALPALRVASDDGVLAEEDEALAGGELAEAREDDAGYRVTALRAMALLTGVCHLALKEPEHPKLIIRCVMLAADLPGAVSGREVARLYGLSPERISQRVEEIQRRFNLRKNQHNKSAAAVAAYRVNAGLVNQPKPA